MIYKKIVRPILFQFDSEKAHHFTLRAGQRLATSLLAPAVGSIFKFEHERLKTKAFGLVFPNPIGLAAGGDKDAEALDLFEILGFGHIEVGTVTPRPQPGNPQPRIFRIPDDEALINRLGFPSQGALVVGERLQAWRALGKKGVIGANLGKMKDTSLEDAAHDYIETFRRLEPAIDYAVVNVSSPNTPELRKLQASNFLRPLLLQLQEQNTRGMPLLVKVSPDLERRDLIEVVETAIECRLAGIVVANTTTSREGLSTMTNEAGGLSGRPLFDRTLHSVEVAVRASAGDLDVVAVGGVVSSDDAFALIKRGARLVQLYTALVYQGPSLVRTLKSGLLRTLDARGILNLEDARGTGLK